MKWSTSLVVASGVSGLFLISQLRQEFDPLIGHWEPARVIQDGRDQSLSKAFRLFLDINHGRASVASYWTCGVRCCTFAEGDMEVCGSDIALFESNRILGERASSPCAHLTLLANGRISFQADLEDGEATIEFAREENAETIFDWFRWF